ncbi:hypothetical protein JL722_9121 [Aureococcus anophagefferens]|nr:hypothetical protein JL722_9121 [Aureococcus anophagefferens]
MAAEKLEFTVTWAAAGLAKPLSAKIVCPRKLEDAPVAELLAAVVDGFNKKGAKKAPGAFRPAALGDLACAVGGRAVDVGATVRAQLPRGCVLDLSRGAAPPAPEHAPEDATAAPEHATAAPEHATAAPEHATAAPEETAAPEDATAAPEAATAAPEAAADDDGDGDGDGDLATSIALYEKRIEKLEDALVYHWRQKAPKAQLAAIEHKLKKYKKKKHKAKKRLKELRGEAGDLPRPLERPPKDAADKSYRDAVEHDANSETMRAVDAQRERDAAAASEANAKTEVRGGVTYRVFEGDAEKEAEEDPLRPRLPDGKQLVSPGYEAKVAEDKAKAREAAKTLDGTYASGFMKPAPKKPVLKKGFFEDAKKGAPSKPWKAWRCERSALAGEHAIHRLELAKQRLDRLVPTAAWRGFAHRGGFVSPPDALECFGVVDALGECGDRTCGTHRLTKPGVRRGFVDRLCAAYAEKVGPRAPLRYVSIGSGLCLLDFEILCTLKAKYGIRARAVLLVDPLGGAFESDDDGHISDYVYPDCDNCRALASVDELVLASRDRRDLYADASLVVCADATCQDAAADAAREQGFGVDADRAFTAATALLVDGGLYATLSDVGDAIRSRAAKLQQRARSNVSAQAGRAAALEPFPLLDEDLAKLPPLKGGLVVEVPGTTGRLRVRGRVGGDRRGRLLVARDAGHGEGAAGDAAPVGPGVPRAADYGSVVNADRGGWILVRDPFRGNLERPLRVVHAKGAVARRGREFDSRAVWELPPGTVVEVLERGVTGCDKRAPRSRVATLFDIVGPTRGGGVVGWVSDKTLGAYDGAPMPVFDRVDHTAERRAPPGGKPEPCRRWTDPNARFDLPGARARRRDERRRRGAEERGELRGEWKPPSAAQRKAVVEDRAAHGAVAPAVAAGVEDGGGHGERAWNGAAAAARSPGGAGAAATTAAPRRRATSAAPRRAAAAWSAAAPSTLQRPGERPTVRVPRRSGEYGQYASGERTPGGGARTPGSGKAIVVAPRAASTAAEAVPQGAPRMFAAPDDIRKRTIVSQHIVLGCREDAMDLKGLQELGVTHVLNACSQLPNYHPDHFVYHKIAILDAPKAPIVTCAEVAAQFLQRVERVGGRCLVHCIAGSSRSVTLTLMHLMISTAPLHVGFHHVNRMRPQANPNEGFKLQLALLEVKVLGGSSVAAKDAGTQWAFYEWNVRKATVPQIRTARQGPARARGNAESSSCVLS